MKNKKSTQQSDRDRHRDQLKLSRRNGTLADRPLPVLVEKPMILIVCEGKNTEPSYFSKFRLSNATVKPIGEGYNTISLVNRATELSERMKYDQVWCVFDKDDFGNGDFNEAVHIAEKNGFGVAYSNQCFEYWILLHFNDHQGAGMSRQEFHDRINSALKEFKIIYEGKSSKFVTEELFEIMDGIDDKTGKERKILAIERAERNYNNFDHKNPATEESSTTVFRLVKELLKYI